MYNIQKVKTWLKASAKKPQSRSGHLHLIHDATSKLISDTCIIIQATYEMQPTLLEIFGHLNGGAITSNGYQEYAGSLINYLPTSIEKVEPFRLINSCLTYHGDKGKYRILHLDGKKILINEKYVDLFCNFEQLYLYLPSADLKFGVYATLDDVFAGLIMPLNPDSIAPFLETFDFRAGSETKK